MRLVSLLKKQYTSDRGPTQLHYDSQENWVCMLCPIRSHHECGLAKRRCRTVWQKSPVEEEQEDIYIKYPMARYALPVRVKLHAGDCLYIPVYWFHEVITRSGVRCMSVNWWRHPEQSKKDAIGQLLCGQSHRKASAKC